MCSNYWACSQSVHPVLLLNLRSTRRELEKADVPCIGRWILNHWTTGECIFLHLMSFYLSALCLPRLLYCVTLLKCKLIFIISILSAKRKKEGNEVGGFSVRKGLGHRGNAIEGWQWNCKRTISGIGQHDLVLEMVTVVPQLSPTMWAAQKQRKQK